MFKKIYKSMNEQIHPKEDLIKRTIDQSKSLKNKRKTKYRKPSIVMVVLVVLLTITPVLASNVPVIYDLMYLVSPSVAQFFMPVEKSYIDNDIKMEVVSASIHENQVEVYITMQDLKGNRIDGTTDLYDSYSINRPFDSGAYCEKVGFDKDTNTVTFLIVINEWGNKEIQGDKITFTVEEFLSDRKNYNNMSIPLDLSTISETKNIQKVNDGVTYVDGMGKLDDEKTVLIPSSKTEKIDVDGVDISSVGYIGNNLHVQLGIPKGYKNNNYGYLYLKNINGNIVKDAYEGIYFDNKKDSDRKDSVRYIEYAFDVPKEEIESYSLYGDFKTYGIRMEGNWKVTFPIEKIEKQNKL